MTEKLRMATATLRPATVHLIEPDAPRYRSWLTARCGARVDRGEDRRFQHLPVTCERCLALQDQDDTALAQLIGDSDRAEAEP
jgi:hypothetical protein